MSPKPISLTRFLIQEQHAGHINADLRLLIEVVARACKTISTAVGKGALGGVLGDAGTGNVQGEAQKKLDVLSNEILLEANEWGGHLAGLASEEMEHAHPIPNAYPKGNYLLLFDPLDGSSNIDVNVAVGTIFSVLHCPDGDHRAERRAFPAAGQRAGLRRLHRLRAEHDAGADHRPRHARLHARPRAGQLHADPARHAGARRTTQEFAINASNQRHWHPPMQRYVADLLAGKDGPRGKDFNMRWVASMVADVHRILTRGGIFIYPADRKDPSKPGRLRLMYEANPMAFIVEQAGGAATTGRSRLMDVAPDPACTSACRCSWARGTRSKWPRATTSTRRRAKPNAG